MKNAVHRRLVAWSQPLWKELEKLEFKEDPPKHKNVKVRTFRKGNKIVNVSIDGLSLSEKIKDPKKNGITLEEKRTGQRIFYQGLTIHDEILKFFSTRNPISIDEQIRSVHGDEEGDS